MFLLLLLLFLTTTAFDLGDSPPLYEHLNSVSYHDLIRRAREAPLIIALLNETSPDFAAHEGAFNKAASIFGCLISGGVHAMFCGDDERARFIAVDEAGPAAAPLPTATLYVRGLRQSRFDLPVTAKATASTATCAATSAPASCVASSTSGTSEDEPSRCRWTYGLILRWAIYGVFGVSLVADGEELRSLHNGDTKESSQEKVVVGFFESLCDGSARQMVDAVSGLRSHTGGPYNQMPKIAISTNRTLSLEYTEALPQHVPRAPRVLVIMPGGARLRFPQHLTFNTAELQQWLAGILRLTPGMQDPDEL